MSLPEDIRERVFSILMRYAGSFDERESIDEVILLLEEVDRKARIAGMEQACSRVLRRTEIPKDAKNPTRDIVAMVGEECARIISEDIAQLQSPSKESKSKEPRS